ncbi:MAG: glycosyltransferase family 1 protein [Vampirovibrionales bacterium]|nr:glycosyltransferase family 1 protein [Vampirovibrionales bacterium]
MLPQQITSHETLLIITDAWEPQTNGVVTTIKSITAYLEQQGYTVVVLTPQRFFTVPTFYPNLHLSVPLFVGHHIRMVCPTRILIMTEGPLGMAARWYCARKHIPFITALTTKWPEYICTHIGFPPVRWSYWLLRRFHRAATTTLVATQSLKTFLERKGFNNLTLWTRGVDTQRFYPNTEATEAMDFLPDCPRPLYLYAGRVSQEKNIDDFLTMAVEGTKVVVGTGPALELLKQQYPTAVFLGLQTGETLRNIYASCDVLVFPSKTDTFGLVMLEALACGTPVVAFNVTGPRDIFSDETDAAALVATPEALAAEAQRLARQKPALLLQCVTIAQRYSWSKAVETLLAHWPGIVWPP